MFQALIGPISELAGSFMQGQINKQKAKIMKSRDSFSRFIFNLQLSRFR